MVADRTSAVGLYRMKSSGWAGNRVASSTIMVYNRLRRQFWPSRLFDPNQLLRRRFPPYVLALANSCAAHCDRTVWGWNWSPDGCHPQPRSYPIFRQLGWQCERYQQILLLFG